LIDYYKLRFQIEFNSCGAKQFWGLENFINQSQTTVTNAANLSFLNFFPHLINICKFIHVQAVVSTQTKKPFNLLMLQPSEVIILLNSRGKRISLWQAAIAVGDNNMN
jgi:hypothetical protein